MLSAAAHYAALAHRVELLRGEGSDAIGGTTDIDWPPAPIASEAYDPSIRSTCGAAWP
jgi:hypothetical protein